MIAIAIAIVVWLLSADTFVARVFFSRFRLVCFGVYEVSEHFFMSSLNVCTRLHASGLL